MQQFFQKLLKFTSLEFSEGSAVFGTNFIVPVILIIAALFAAFGAVFYLTNLFSQKKVRFISIFLRGLALLLLVLPLLEPVLITPDVVPNENFLAVLTDNSLSMTITDGRFTETRSGDMKYILNDPDTGVLPELEQNFKVRHYSFDTGIERSDTLTMKPPDGIGTGISSAIARVISDFKGLPLSGIVLLTDGGDNTNDDPFETARELRSRNIPLHIIGLGQEALSNERELLDLSAGKGLEEGTGAEVSVKVRSWIEETGPVNLNIYQGDRLVHTETTMLKGDGKIDQFSFFYDPEEKGAVEYSLKIDPLPDEKNSANNIQNMLIDTRKDTIRVLYFEGHLRSDFKFIKRSLEDDQVVQFTSVSRTGSNKYYRQGITDVNELVSGFPQTEEELNRFKAVIFGDIEASYFSLEQLYMIEKFVRERGGGFLMLGGRSSFAEGDYNGTPVSDLLPVEIDPGRRQVVAKRFYDDTKPALDQGFKFQLTRAGLLNPLLNLAPDAGTNRALWGEMPPLTSINFLGTVKPGATVLAVKPKDQYGEEEPLFITQRYGRGRAAALATSSTWRWQMMLDSRDTRHERFWRQLVRWLVTSAPDNVNIEMTGNVFTHREEIPVRISVYGDDFEPVDFARIDGRIISPDGEQRSIRFYPDLSVEGEYLSRFTPDQNGVYRLEVNAAENDLQVGSETGYFLVRPSKKEFFDATLKKKFLADIAAESGGIYYEPEDVSNLFSNLRTRKSNTSVFRQEYLWDMPILFLIAFLLLTAEWIYRRRRGLP